jgi:hypothetical protein
MTKISNYENSYFPDLVAICRAKFGEEEGDKIYAAAETKLGELLAEMDCRGSKAIEKHMRKNMLPILAYYMALRNVKAMSKTEAKENVLLVTQRQALAGMKKYRKLGHMPLGYIFFRLFAKFVVKRNYPSEGWNIKWPSSGKREVWFNMHSCVYYETMKKYHCPELCSVFCANDTTAFRGLQPNIDFVRTGTIAGGKSYCDFHFVKNSSARVLMKSGSLKMKPKKK